MIGTIVVRHGTPYVVVLETDLPDCGWWRKFWIEHFSDTIIGYLLPIVEAKQ